MGKREKNTDKPLKRGCIALYCWSGINLFLSTLILFLVVSGISDSPLLSMVFVPSEVAGLSPKVIGAMNTLTILYNSYAVASQCRAEPVIYNGYGPDGICAVWPETINVMLSDFTGRNSSKQLVFCLR